MDAREKIVLAAIECIEAHGMKGTTIRAVAKQAECNSAAISYYFGGMENLVNIAMSRTLGEGFNLSDFVELEDKDFREYLMAVFSFLIKGSQMYPNLTKAHFYKIFNLDDYNAPLTAVINGFLEDILAKIRSKTDLPESALRQKLFVLMSQVVYFISAPRLLSSFAGGTDNETVIAELVHRLF